MKLEIESNIPPKKDANGKWKEAREAIKVMEVGQSFVFPVEEQSGMLYTIAKNAGRKISVSKIESGKYRVWRTA